MEVSVHSDLLPEIYEKIIEMGSLIDARSWQKVSRSHGHLATAHILRKFTRSDGYGSTEPDISKILDTYRDMEWEEQKFLKEVLLDWSQNRTEHGALGLSYEEVVVKENFPDGAEVEKRELRPKIDHGMLKPGKEFVYLLTTGQISALPNLIRTTVRLDPGYIAFAVFLLASFPVLDDITIRVMEENWALINNSEVIEILIKIRGNCKPLQLAVGQLTKEQQWSFPDVDTKDADLSVAASLLALEPEFYDGCVKLIQYLCTIGADDQAVRILFMAGLTHWWTTRGQQQDFRLMAIDQFLQIINAVKSRPSFVLEGAELLTHFCNRTQFGKNDFPNIYRFIRTFLGNQELEPAISILLKALSKVNSAQTVFTGLLSFGWKEVRQIPRLLECGMEDLLDDLVIMIAGFTDYDSLTQDLFTKYENILKKETVKKMLASRGIEHLDGMFSIQTAKQSSKLFDFWLSTTRFRNTLSEIYKYLIETSADEAFILSFVHKKFVFTVPDDTIDGAIRDSDSINLPLQMYCIAVDYPSVRAYLYEKILAYKFTSALCVNMLFTTIHTLPQKLITSQNPSEAMDRLSDIVVSKMTLNVLMGRIYGIKEYDILLYSVLSRQYETERLDTLIKRILSSNMDNVYLKLCKLLVPVDKMGPFLDAIFSSHRLFHRTFKQLADANNISEEYITAFVNHETFPMKKSFLLANERERLMKILSSL